MSINARIENALAGIAENIWPMACPGESPPEKYIVYNPELEAPEDFGDDTGQEWMNHMQIHYYAAGNANVLKTKKEIRERLEAAGFTVSGVQTFYEKDIPGGYTHVCVECSAEEEQ